MQFNEYKSSNYWEAMRRANASKASRPKVSREDTINGLIVCALLTSFFFLYPLACLLEG